MKTHLISGFFGRNSKPSHSFFGSKASRSFGLFNWGKKTTEIQKKDEWDFSDLPNLYKLIEKKRETRDKSIGLLPPKTTDQLTVFMEMDKVFLYTFVPNEEGYLQAPLR